MQYAHSTREVVQEIAANGTKEAIFGLMVQGMRRVPAWFGPVPNGGAGADDGYCPVFCTHVLTQFGLEPGKMHETIARQP